MLLKQLVKTDFKLRYQGSFLGYVWTLLRPLALFAILYVVFGKFLKIGDSVPHFPIYLLLGIVVWNYFAEVTSGSVAAIVGKGELIRKINFPKYVIVLAGSFSALINLCINFVVVGLFLYINDVDIRTIATTLPIFIVELFIFSLALAFFLSAAYVRFRDINYIWEVIMQAAFYITPILYPLSLLPENAAKIIMLNPMAQIIQDMRYVLVTDKTLTMSGVYNSHYIRAVPVGVTILLVVIAAVYFKKRSRYFAEDV
ncbi:ABC transporter permease [Candidatus Saccharibacteria bacterium]|nr:ABC transporter permease [Candidatus Saccharibacteria bacterium]